MRYAVCLNEQGRFSSVNIGDFTKRPEVNDRHVFKGIFAETIDELAEQVNAAVKSVAAYADPFQVVEVVGVKQQGQTSNAQRPTFNAQ